MVSSVQDSTYQEVQKLCTTNVQLQDEIVRLGGKVPNKDRSGSASIKSRLGDADKKENAACFKKLSIFYFLNSV